MEEQARVTETDSHGDTWVIPQRNQSCASCETANGCGVLSLAGLFGHHTARIKVLNPINAKVGDQVLIVISDRAVLRAILLAYLFPLFCLFFSASIAQFLFQLPDGAVIAFAFIGMMAGFAILFLLGLVNQSKKNWQPVIRAVIQSEKIKFTVQGT